MKNDLYKRYTSTAYAKKDQGEAMIRLDVEWFKSKITSFLPKNKKAKILDLGCGYGRYVKALKECGYSDVTGVDISPEQVAYAKNELNLTNIIESDITLYFDRDKCKYDCILVFDVLEHFEIDDLLELLKKIEGALSPGGTLVIRVPNALAPISPHCFKDITHKQYFTSLSMGQLLNNYEFSEIQCYEAVPYIHGIVSLTRLCLWYGVVRPLISVFMLIAYGSRVGGIYTANLIMIAKKKS